MFRITFLPARFGDSIWIELGSSRAPRRILIDGGTRGTRSEIRQRLASHVSSDAPHLDLLVVTHVDRDHIEGVLGLLEESDDSLRIGDVWFNGWGHLPQNTEDERFGPVQGERLSQRILDLDLPWNHAFGGQPVVVDDDGPLPKRSIGGLDLTLLSPTRKALEELRPVWEREVRKANLDPGFGLEPNDEVTDGDERFGAQDLPDIEALAVSQFEEDESKANASSIAFLAELEGRRVLFAADAPAGALEASLERLSPGTPLPIDLFKISHHGSRTTTSRSLIDKVRCPRFVFSTNGSNYGHPHLEAVARVVDAGGDHPELLFNYRSAHNEIWDLDLLQARHGYTTCYPSSGAEGLTISL